MAAPAAFFRQKAIVARNRFRGVLRRGIVPKLSRANHWLIAQGAWLGIWLLRRLPEDRALDTAAWVARRIGPRFGRHRTAVDNLRHAYPEKSAAEVEAIARDMWGHMARLAAEYIFLDQLFDYRPDDPRQGRIEIAGEERFLKLASEAGRPHIVFTAHLGSFELLPVACALHGTPFTSLFRPPNNPYIAGFLDSKRTSTMGDLLASSRGAAFSLSAVLEKGGNVGALVDQKFSDGILTSFFGRPCQSNPIVPMLARRFDCDVYPARSMRLPGNRYRLEIEEKLELARNDDGDIDVAAATQQLNDVVERWVREDPGQWMWFHKRWSLSGRQRRRKQPKRAAGDTGAAPSSAAQDTAAPTSPGRLSPCTISQAQRDPQDG